MTGARARIGGEGKGWMDRARARWLGLGLDGLGLLGQSTLGIAVKGSPSHRREHSEALLCNVLQA